MNIYLKVSLDQMFSKKKKKKHSVDSHSKQENTIIIIIAKFSYDLENGSRSPNRYECVKLNSGKPWHSFKDLKSTNKGFPRQ